MAISSFFPFGIGGLIGVIFILVMGDVEASSKGNDVGLGHWLGVEEPVDLPNTWMCFRGRFEWDGVSTPSAARIACDSKYWLWVNGELVVFEGGLKRGPNPMDTYVDAVRLSDVLRPGMNTIAVLVWYWGKHGFSHNDSGQAGLFFELPEVSLNWQARLHPAFGDTEAPHPNFRLPESNVHFDARRDLVGWFEAEFDDSSWRPATVLGVEGSAPWGKLHPRPIPMWKDSGLRKYASVTLPDAATGGQVVAQLPYNAQVSAFMRVRASAGLRIDVRTDAYDNFPNGPSVRGEYITRDGEQQFEFPNWFSGHAVHYDFPAGVEVLDLKYRETGYDADFSGSFECDDEGLNELWRRARRTLYITMRDTYMDCPDRERAQWWGDVVNELGEAFYALDAERGPLLARKGIEELVAWRKPDGSLYSPIPAGRPPSFGSGPVGKLVRDGTWDRELPLQMLASVGWYGFWTYYWYSGDADTVIAAYPAVRDYLALWEREASGLVRHRAGDWDWPDWGRNADMPVLENAWYALALKGAKALAELAGKNDDAILFQDRLDALSASFDRFFWHGDAYRSDNLTGDPDDRANAMAVVAGLVPAERFPALLDVFAHSRYASPYMEKYVLEALFLMGQPEAALQRMKQRYERMLADPITTLWENFGGGEDRYGSGTYNHAWSGGPLTLMSQYVAGVSPLAPQWESVLVAPQPGGLDRVSCVVPTRRGEIEVKWARDDAGLMVEIILPAGIMGEFEPPLEWGTEGTRIWLNRQEVDLKEGRLSLAPGTNRIRLSP